jgi:MtN3 and saliva related transmembrane protein
MVPDIPSFVSTIGFIAGSLTTVAFLPQLMHTWKHKSAREISYGMLLTFCAGVAFWLFYGHLLHAWPIILANAATLALAVSILILKIRYK